MRKPLKPNAAFCETEKASVTAACEQLIEAFLKPRFLPAIEPTEFNYPVDILGKWHGAKYRFIQRYRSGFADNLGEEFDAPFARLDWISRDRFDIQWHRHTGEWFRLHSGLTLVKAIETLDPTVPCTRVGRPQSQNIQQTGTLRPTPKGYVEKVISAAVRFRSGLPWIPLCSLFRPCVTDFFNSLLELRLGIRPTNLKYIHLRQHCKRGSNCKLEKTPILGTPFSNRREEG